MSHKLTYFLPNNIRKIRPIREIILMFDGGSRGNPGKSGAGYTLTNNSTNKEISYGYIYLGHTTNNIAEYQGLIAGLEAVTRHGITDVQVYGDSKLVVNQMNGEWKVRSSTIQSLHARATTLATRIGNVTYQHVRRNQNKRADELANEAMDTKCCFHSDS